MTKLMGEMSFRAAIKDKVVHSLKVFHRNRLWFSLERQGSKFLYTDYFGRPRVIDKLDQVDPETFSTPLAARVFEAFEPGEKTSGDLHRLFPGCMIRSGTSAKQKKAVAEEYIDPLMRRELNPENS